MRVQRLPGNPIITPNLDPSLGDNVNGPSLIRVPEWLADPLGRYYLYVAHHEGTFIRLACADDLTGPWRIYRTGVLDLATSGFDHHIASPDVHVVPERGEIRLYYHGRDAAAAGQDQHTRVAISTDGVRFTPVGPRLGLPYWRVWRWRAWWYALAMPGQFYRSRNGLTEFEAGPRLFTPSMRHSAVRLTGDTLSVFFTNVGDAPERILVSTITLTDDWHMWRPSDPVTVLEPETAWEGANLPIEPSHRGAVYGPVRQLRDPAIFEEAGRVYLLYSVAGEAGIAIAEVVPG